MTDFEDLFGRAGFDSDVRVEFGEGRFSDFFEGLFGEGAGVADGGPLRGRDREAVLELSLEEALVGGRRRLSLDDAGASRSRSRPGCVKVSAFGSPVRACRVALGDRRATYTFSCVSGLILAFAGRATTCRSICG